MHVVRFALLVTLFAAAAASHAADPPGQLLVKPLGGQVQLRLDRSPVAPVGGTRYRLDLESSADLKAWTLSEELTGSDDQPPQVEVATGPDHRFFRVRAEIEESGSPAEAAELFGYDRIFKEELRTAGFLTPEEFAARHKPSDAYLSALTFDPTTAKYWDQFNADPAAVNAELPPDSPDKRLYDFRLNAQELALFKTNGFVVSERLGSGTFADVLYRIFSDDLPVFVSADAALHAWHFSYQRLLEESEETQLAQALQQVLDGMHASLVLTPTSLLSGPLRDSLTDADYLLTVARSLALGRRAPTAWNDASTEANVTAALKAIADLQFIENFPVFGTNRIVDFSQFTVRGHYERSAYLENYFRAFMWTARLDLRMLAARPDPQSLRELGTAVVLSHVLGASGQAERWRQLDDLIRLFVGRADAMTFGQLQPLLAAAGLDRLESLSSMAQLEALHQKIVDGQIGVQLIAGDAYYSPFGFEQYQLPRAFVLTGQRFNLDGWALGQVIYDRIRWNVEIPGFTESGKVIRRYTSGLDMVYSVLGNRQIGWEIAQRMLDVDSRSGFRDGLPYAHNLTALAATFDRIPAAAWDDSIATRWLAALRELSVPTTDAHFPEAMRTRAWTMRVLNTQLASYTELKHDTVLYAKQPYTGMIACEYPAGFVEPVPAFWKKMREMASSTAAAFERLPASGVITVSMPESGIMNFPIDLGQRQAARIAFCRSFAEQMAVLEGLASKELAQEPFNDAEVGFIRGMMNRRDHIYEGPTFDGWYPGLFYKDYGQLIGAMAGAGASADSNGSNKADQLVTDVHTAPPDQIDPKGGVLHEATGNVDLIMVAIDNGPDRMVYAGPALSHYEFIVPGPELKRLTDSEWQANFPIFDWQPEGHPPPRPEWTRSYLAPK